MNGAILALRLQKEFGVQFTNHIPNRAHWRRHGDLDDTFLVREYVSPNGARIFSTIVPWTWRGRSGLEIALQYDVPVRQLSKARLLISFNEVFSAYGIGLLVADADRDALGYLTARSLSPISI